MSRPCRRRLRCSRPKGWLREILQVVSRGRAPHPPCHHIVTCRTSSSPPHGSSLVKTPTTPPACTEVLDDQGAIPLPRADPEVARKLPSRTSSCVCGALSESAPQWVMRVMRQDK